MATFESAVKTINASQEAVYEKLSDLNNLDKVKDKLPEGKIKGLTFDASSVSVEVPPVGRITLAIADKEPCSCIRFATTASPLPFNLLIQLSSLDDNRCNMKISIEMEVNPYIKAMLQKPLQEGVERFADVLSMIPY